MHRTRGTPPLAWAVPVTVVLPIWVVPFKFTLVPALGPHGILGLADIHVQSHAVCYLGLCPDAGMVVLPPVEEAVWATVPMAVIFLLIWSVTMTLAVLSIVPVFKFVSV